MFGYIKPYKPEMKIKEFDTYKAVYCGLCKQLGKAYGPFARMTLSYDFTFLAMIANGLEEQCGGFRLEKCMVNPLKKKPCLISCDDLIFSASTAMIMFYYKLKDNIKDSKFWGKIKAYLLLPFASGARKKAKKRYPMVDEMVAACMEEQAKIEQSDSLSIDRAAEPSARVLSKIFGMLSTEKSQKAVLERLGYLTGRYVYLIDALDDLADDIKKGSYNIFYKKFLAEGNENLDSIRQYAKNVIYLTTGEIAATYELLDLKRYKPILNNIIYLGLHASMEAVIRKGQSDENGKNQTEILEKTE